jgi:hypothetical protein
MTNQTFSKIETNAATIHNVELEMKVSALLNHSRAIADETCHRFNRFWDMVAIRAIKDQLELSKDVSLCYWFFENDVSA